MLGEKQDYEIDRYTTFTWIDLDGLRSAAGCDLSIGPAQPIGAADPAA
jgi:hypothetical protein